MLIPYNPYLSCHLFFFSQSNLLTLVSSWLGIIRAYYIWAQFPSTPQLAQPALGLGQNRDKATAVGSECSAAQRQVSRVATHRVIRFGPLCASLAVLVAFFIVVVAGSRLTHRCLISVVSHTFVACRQREREGERERCTLTKSLEIYAFSQTMWLHVMRGWFSPPPQPRLEFPSHCYLLCFVLVLDFSSLHALLLGPVARCFSRFALVPSPIRMNSNAVATLRAVWMSP